MLRVLAFLLLSISLFAQTDGPATLPQATMATTMASTPSPNGSKTVGPLDSLPAALNGAQCGDLILVDPANVTVGGVTLPTLVCDAQHWITIQNSGLTVIDEFHRIHPGIPMPKIVLNASNSSIKGGAFVRLIGFEITRPTGTGLVSNLIMPGAGAHDLIFDRDYVHGTPTDETTRGLFLSNTFNVAVINSYFSEFHCMAPGACNDSQAVAGGTSTVVQDGNYLIQNNYLEASGENFLMGGGPATFVPQDITVQYNDFAKPDSWNPGDPSYAPASGKDGFTHPWSVKNLFELKTGRRLLVQGNKMSGTWGGFTQVGFAILLTPKSQGGACSVCAVEDITIRNNVVSKAAAALQLAFTATSDGDWATSGARWSIHDNLFEHLQYPTCYSCGSFLIQLSQAYPLGPSGFLLHDITIDRNSFLVDGWLRLGGLMYIGGPPVEPKMANIRFTNNIIYPGKYAIHTIGGGLSNCATGAITPAQNISACWSGASAFTGNLILFNQPGLAWPAGNYALNVGADIGAAQTALANRKP